MWRIRVLLYIVFFEEGGSKCGSIFLAILYKSANCVEFLTSKQAFRCNFCSTRTFLPVFCSRAQAVTPQSTGHPAPRCPHRCPTPTQAPVPAPCQSPPAPPGRWSKQGGGRCPPRNFGNLQKTLAMYTTMWYHSCARFNKVKTRRVGFDPLFRYYLEAN